MGTIKEPSPVLLVIAVFARREEVLAVGRARVEEAFGPIWLESPSFLVDDFTDYYVGEMGAKLTKRIWAFDRLIDPARLAEIKITTNRFEEEIARSFHDLADGEKEGGDPIPERPINLDPGYVDLGKLILASTKDHRHRIYLRDGIFAETTLYYSAKKWQALPWSYPDYQSEPVTRFLTECREELHRRLKEKKETA